MLKVKDKELEADIKRRQADMDSAITAKATEVRDAAQRLAAVHKELEEAQSQLKAAEKWHERVLF
jgi:hypothetical protein